MDVPVPTTVAFRKTWTHILSDCIGFHHFVSILVRYSWVPGRCIKSVKCKVTVSNSIHACTMWSKFETKRRKNDRIRRGCCLLELNDVFSSVRIRFCCLLWSQFSTFNSRSRRSPRNMCKRWTLRTSRTVLQILFFIFGATSFPNRTTYHGF